jgi:tRNA threonylcarbamoyladenosine biosynthesis protein TsaB
VVILALDTTTRAGSCALWRGDTLVEERTGDPNKTHAERLPNDLARLLADHRLTLKDVKSYAVASGPGSFTGLRVGIATIQGLALVHDRPVVPISALEAFAQCAVVEAIEAGQPPAVNTFIGAWMEAYRGEVFGALYRLAAPLPAVGLAPLVEVVGPSVARPTTLAHEWSYAWQAAGYAGKGLIIGDAVPTSHDVLRGAFPEARLLDAVPIAGMLARIAATEPGRAVRPHAIVPLYVRKPDAELSRARKVNGSGHHAGTSSKITMSSST